MTRPLGRTVVTTAAWLVLTVGVTGCDQDDPSPPDPTESISTSQTETTTINPTETTTTPSIEPATGVLLQGDGLSLHAPEGWEKADPIVDFLETANDPDSTSSLGLASSDAIGEPSLREQAESVIKVGGWLQDPEILAPVTVGGVRMFHLAGQIDAASDLQLIGTIHDGHQVEITLVFDRGVVSPAEQQEIADAVWASVVWD